MHEPIPKQGARLKQVLAERAVVAPGGAKGADDFFTVQGLASVEVELEYLARSMGLRQYLTFRIIRLYRALPRIFAGLKVAIILAVVGASSSNSWALTKGLERCFFGQLEWSTPLPR